MLYVVEKPSGPRSVEDLRDLIISTISKSVYGSLSDEICCSVSVGR